MDRLAGTLSGGEPTNNLDLGSVAQLVSALRGYRGALLVASHDARFVTDLGVRRRWEVVDTGLPREVGATA